MAVGRIEPFDTKDDWNLYVDRLEQYFVVNDVKPEKKGPILITVMGGEAYELLSNLCAPEKPSQRSYEDLVKIMKAHLQPKPSLLAERFKFRLRTQKADESIADYAAELKRLSKDCSFTEKNLKENLRDQFVCGLRNDGIRQRLFTTDDIQYDEAFCIAVAMETAEADSALIADRAHGSGGRSAPEGSVYLVKTTGKQDGRERRSDGTGAGSRSAAGRSARDAGSKAVGWGASGMSGARGGRRTEEKQAEPLNNSRALCAICGDRHQSQLCKFKAYVCRVCNKQGHLKRVCPNLRRSSTFYNVDEDSGDSEDNDSGSSAEVNNYSFESGKVKKCSPYYIDLTVNGSNLTMEIDTGSAISCISKDCFDKMFSNHKLHDSDLQLRYYTGELIKPVGKFMPSMKYKDRFKTLDLYVVRSGKTNLLGRQWLKELGIDWSAVSCHRLDNKNAFNFEQFSSRFAEVFAEGLGRFTGGTVGFQLREGARPVFLRARPLAYALREPVERALDSLVRDGVIEPVSTSDWATPIVPVMKKDGTIRVCGDFKLTLNKCVEVDRFPLPRVEDLLSKLHGGERFTKIDLSQAYTQFELDEESKKYTVINTHKGLFKYNRLIFGLASSPGIFQRKLEQLFCDLPTVGVFLDDVIITGADDHEHLKTLETVFERLQRFGLKIRKDKCIFFARSVTYLGYTISYKGVHTCSDKIKAIKGAPRPGNVSEVRSFLGLVMYYAKFVRHISTVLSPLYNLLKKDVKFCWDDQCEEAFNLVKDKLVSSEVLAHYSLDLPLILTTDASSVGIGAVISHMTGEGERPIAYASRTLKDSEKAYSQIEREALSIIFGVRKFHQYLYGRSFTLRTDHKPLVTIFGDKVGIPVMAASRLQRWAVLLSGYDFEIQYVHSESNVADALSRLPLESSGREVNETTYINFVQEFLPVTRGDVRKQTEADENLKRVVLFLQSGWPHNCSDSNLMPYFARRNELYLDMGCIMWGYRLVIPERLKATLLQELHTGHLGIVKMKSVARSYVWWPGIDADIEGTCKQCTACSAVSTAPPRAPPKPWFFSAEPWSRLHVDFLGPFHGKTFLVVIDASSKWLEVFLMHKTTASAVIAVLRETFARFGLPREIASDNGPPFSSQEYIEFMHRNGVNVTFSAPYHPSSNGAAEGAVKLCKRAVKKALHSGTDLEATLQTYLLAYRNVEHSTTGVSPAMLLQRRNLRCRLDLLKGSREIEERVSRAQERMVDRAGGTSREFKVGEPVLARDFTKGRKWCEGMIESQLGARNYMVRRENGPPVNRHVDQIKYRWFDTSRLRSPQVDDASSPRPVEEVSARSGSSVVPPVNPPGYSLRPRGQLRPPVKYGFELN